MKTKQPKLQECVRDCGKMTRRMVQFLHEDSPRPTCKACDEEEAQHNAEVEAEQTEG